MTGPLGRLLWANRCPRGKNCPGRDGIGVVGVSKLAHLTGELLISVSVHIVVAE